MDVAGLEPAASSLRTRFFALSRNEMRAKSFIYLAPLGTCEQAQAPDGKKNRYRNRNTLPFDSVSTSLAAI